MTDSYCSNMNNKRIFITTEGYYIKKSFHFNENYMVFSGY